MIDTLKKAIDAYGPDMQRNVAIEEMSELTKELCKDRRKLSCKLKIAEEIADVEIMLEQLKIIYSAHEQVEGFKINKIARLRKLLEVGDPVYDPDTQELLGYI